MRGLKHFVSGLCFVATLAITALVQANSITAAFSAGTIASGGREITANYTTTNPCCTDIRWLQLAQITQQAGATALPAAFAPFTAPGGAIDPQAGQPIGGPPAADNLPWYDITYPTAAARAAGGVPANQNGSGRFYYDAPQGLGQYGPLTVNFTTLLVCLGANNTASILGGFTWSVSVTGGGLKMNAAPYTTTTTGPTLIDSTNQGTINTMAALFNGNTGKNGPLPTFNSASNAVADKPGQGWTLTTTKCAANCAYLPLPSSSEGIAVGLVFVAIASRHVRREMANV